MDLNYFRQQIPQLKGLDDQSALDLLHKHYYPSADKQRMADVLGVKAPEVPKPERSTMRAVGDLATQFAGGAVSGVRMMSDVFGADNAVSGGLRSAEEALSALQSAAAKADQQEIAAIMQEAEGKGWGEQIASGLKAFGVAPGAMMAQALGTSLPTLATAAIPGAGPAAVAARLGMAGAVGGAQGAGNIKGVIYEDVKRKLAADPTLTPEQIEARAVKAQAYGGDNAGQIALGGGLGVLAGSTGMERVAAGLRNGVTKAAPGMLGRVGMGAATEAVPEALQGGQEKFAGNTALVSEGFDVDPWSGVVAQGTMEAAAGGLMGGAFGVPNPTVKTEQLSPGDQIRATEGVPEAGPMTRAANVATEQKAKAADATLQLGFNPLAGTPVVFPDGSVALGSEQADAKRGQDAQAANIEQMAARRPPMVASDAARILDEAKTRGLDFTAAPHPEGGFMVVPRNWVMPALAAEAEAELSDTLARMQQADAAPVERAPRTRTEGRELSLPTDPVANYVNDLRQVNTPAAKLYVRDFDAGRITPADVQERMAAERGKTPDERIAAAAAEGLRMNPKGDPFKTLMAAQRAAKTEPGQIIQVESGYAIRPQQESTSEPAGLAKAQPEAADAAGSQPVPPAQGQDAGALSSQPSDADMARQAVTKADELGLKGAERRESVIEDLSSAWGMTKDEVAEAPETIAALQRRPAKAAKTKATERYVDGVIRQAEVAGAEMRERANQQEATNVQNAPQSSGNPGQVAQTPASEAPAPAGGDAAAASGAPAAGDGAGVRADGVKRSMGRYGDAMTITQADAKVKELEKEARDLRKKAGEAPTKFMETTARDGATRAATLARKLRDDIKDAVGAYSDARAEFESLKSGTGGVQADGVSAEQAGGWDFVASLEKDAGRGFKTNEDGIELIKRATQAMNPAGKAAITRTIDRFSSVQKDGSRLIKPGFYDAVAEKFRYSEHMLTEAIEQARRAAQAPQAADLSTNPPKIDTSAAPVQETAKSEQVESPVRQKAIERVDKGTAYFGTQEKADDFIKNGAIKDTHEVVQTKAGRFEVKAKAGAAPATDPASRETRIATTLADGGKVVNGELRTRSGMGLMKLTPEEISKTPSDKQDTPEAIKQRLNAVYPARDGATSGGRIYNPDGSYYNAPKETAIERRNRLIAERKAASQPKTEAQDSQYTLVGRNSDGKTIMADKRGVRSYSENGIRIEEAVSMRPVRGGGMELSIENRRDEFKTVDELGSQDDTDQDPEMRAYESGATASTRAADRERVAGAAQPEKHADKPGVVKVPADVAVAIEGQLKKQKDRVARLTREAQRDGMSLDEKTAAQTKVKAAETTLRKMRTSIFDAEDAAIKALASGNPADFAAHADVFSDAADVIQAQAGKTSAPKPVSVTRAGAGAVAIVIDPSALRNQAPAANPATPPPAANTIFTEDAAAAARARLKAKLGRLNSGLDPEMMMDGITLAGYHIEKGARTFAAYARAMVEDLGDGVKPYLKSWYMGVKYDPRASAFDGMDGAAYVENFKEENLGQDVSVGDWYNAIDTRTRGNLLAKIGINNQAPDTSWGQLRRENQPKIEAYYAGLNTVAPKAAPAQNPPTPTESDNAAPDKPSPKALENLPPQDDGGPESPRETGAGPASGGSPSGKPDSGADGKRVPAARGARGGAGRVSNPATGAASGGRPRGAGADGAGAGVPQADGRLNTPETASTPNIPAANFAITPDLNLGVGGEVAKFNDNIAAIKTLKALESERRRATPNEQRVLARFVGWGGLANAFPNPETGKFKSEWEKRGNELREMLTPSEYRAASRSTRNAHYTSEVVVGAMWDAARRLGYRNGLALESSMGSGNFLGLMPGDLAARFIGVEYDSITARLAGALYPQATVLHSGFQDVALPEGAFDLDIGNPPFGSESLRFQYKPELRGVSIHNQFFRAGIDALRPGGLKISVVSSFLMDSQDKSTRLALASKAKLVAAIRLPSTAFKENARTDVVTDIIILQRRTKQDEVDATEAMRLLTKPPSPKELKDMGQEGRQRASMLTSKYGKELAWVTTSPVADPLGGEPLLVNDYFAQNPGQIVGTMDRSGTMRTSGMMNVRLDDPTTLGERLGNLVAKLPQGIMDTASDVAARTEQAYKLLGEAMRISVDRQEPGHVSFDEDGKLTRVIEREYGDGTVLQRQAVTPQSPWSAQLFVDSLGRWYKVDVRMDDAGKPVKAIKDGKATKFNEYVRTTYEKEADIPDSMRLGRLDYERMVELVGLRDLLKRQLVLETEDAPRLMMEGNRKKLAKAYQAYVDKHGPINRRANAALVSEMPDGGLVLALESSYEPARTAEQAKKSGLPKQGEAVKPAPIMRERVVPKYEPPTSADTPADALAITLAERGVVDVEHIAKLLKQTPEEAEAALTSGDKPLIFKDPETNTFETANAYLSGQVRRKLMAAKSAGLAQNVKALEAVQPERWGAENVSVQIGASWVPTKVYGDFAEHLMGGTARVSFSPLTNTFGVRVSDADRSKADQWGTERMGGVTILEKLLNSQSPTVTYKDSEGKVHTDKDATTLAILKGREIAAEFGDWIFKDGDRREQLVEIFNEKFNTRVTRQYDGQHLKLPGKVPDAILKMRRHQMNAIWRGISSRSMLVDHTVGAGKTFTAIARAMERRRMGLAQKPTVVVPNHLVEQWAADVYRLYPAAKVLAATKKDFEKKNRRRLLSRVATGDYDIVILPHSSFGFVGISPETELRYLEEELQQALAAVKEAEEQAEEDGNTGFRKPVGVKEAERLVAKIESRMAIVREGARDRLLTFEQLGIDDLTIDEAHEFKNLFYSSRLTKVRGMGDKLGSRKAADLYNKVRVLRDNGGAVTFMTGTPVSNSVVELYTMMRYLAPNELREMGMEHFDAWRAQFVDATPAFEPNESGRLQEVTRLGRTWSNMRNLMDLYYGFTDAVTNEDIKKWYREDNGGKEFPIPKVKGGERQLVKVKPTPAQESYLKEIIAGFDSLPDIKDIQERNAERLRLMDRARKLSLDVRAALPGSPSKEEGGKLDQIAAEVKRIYTQFTPDLGTQLVFLDRSVPKSKGDDKKIKEFDELVAKRDKALKDEDDAAFQKLSETLEAYDSQEIEELRRAQAGGWNAYQQIKDNMIAMGIPAAEIRFVQDANTDEQKQALFDAVNGGKVRVLIGSTPRMGAGTNVQQRLVGLHHADVTWKPSDIEQREGRIIRQGNQLLAKYGDSFEVEILAYATERTVDAKMWSLNATKLKAINGLRKYTGDFTMDLEDEESVSMAEMAALASGNPLLLERVTLDSEIQNLELQERAHRRKLYGASDSLKRAQRIIETYPDLIKQVNQVAEQLAEPVKALNERAAARRVTVDGVTFDRYKEAMKAAVDAIAVQQAGNENARYAIAINGARLTSKAAIDDALGAGFGDAAPFEVEIQGEAFTQRTAAGRALSAILSPKAASKKGGGTIGSMMGMDLNYMFSESRFTKDGVDLDVWLEKDGKTIASDVANDHNPGMQYTTAQMRDLLGRLADEVVSKARPSRVESMQGELAAARSSVPRLEERASEPFPKAQELKNKRQRLNKVVAILTGGDVAPDEVEAAPNASPNMNQTGAPEADVVFSQGLLAPASLGPKPTLDQVQRLIDKIQQIAKNVLPISVVADPSQIAGLDVPVGTKPSGALMGGRIYLFAGNLKSTGDAYVTLFHELFHLGLQKVIPAEDYAALLTQFARGPLVQRYVRMWKDSAEGTQKAGTMNAAAYEALAAEEALAMVSEELAASNNMGSRRLPGLVKVVLSWMAKVADRVGMPASFGDWMRGLSRTNAEKFVSDMIRAAMGGPNNLARVRSKYGTQVQNLSSQTRLSAVERPDGEGVRSTVQQTLMDAVPQGVIDRLSDISTSQRGFNRWWHRTVGTQLHKAKTNKQFAPVYYAVQDFMKDVSRMATLAADQAPDLLPQVDTLGDVKKLLPQMGIAGGRQRKADVKQASDALFDGTLRYTRDEDGAAVPAQEDDAKGLVWTNAELKARGMSDEAIKLYRQARAAIEQSLDNLLAADVYRMATAMKPEYLADNPAAHAALMDKARKAAASGTPADAVRMVRQALEDQAGKAEVSIRQLRAKKMDTATQTALKDLSTAFNGIQELLDKLEDKDARISELKDAGYAPLMRFGQYTVDAVSAAGERVHFGMYESQMASNQAARKFREQGLTVSQGIQSQKDFELLKGVSPETAMLFADMMGLEKNEAMQAWLQNALAQQSALKRHIRRKGVEGFDDDASRVVAAFITSNSRAASRALHGMRIQERVENVRDGDVKDEAIALAQYVENPKEEAQALRSLLFVNYIGGSVASALVNLTQTVVQTFPYLSQFGGPLKAGQRLGAAMKAVAGKITDPALAAAVKRAEEDGVIKPQEVFQLQAEASRTMGSDLRIRAGLALWGSFFQAAETFNRRVAFIAAYQTAKEQGIADPFAFAENAVDETQGTFNKGNRPNWARGAVGATLFTFKTFTVQYVEFLKRLPAKEKALALGVLVLLSGIRGLPFAADAEDLLDTVAQGLGYNFTTKEQMDRFLVATLGSGFADFLQHGASTIPGVPFDVSARLGMADLLPGTGLLKKSETAKENQVLEAFGVTGSFVRDALKGEFRPIAIRNLAKGIEMYDRGIYTDSRGRTVMEVDGTDALVKSIGLQPADVAGESRTVRMQYEKRALFSKVKSEITEAMALAQFEGNPEKVKVARAKLDDWNEKNPEARIVLNTQAVRRRVVEMRRDRTDRFIRATPKELRADAREALQ